MSMQQSSPGTLVDSLRTVKRALPGIAVFLFGIFLPLIALLTELTTGMSAQAFFDPIPSWLHVALVGLVPLGNGLVWYAVRYNKTVHPGLLSLSNGAVLGISGFYTLVFIPLTPIAIMLFWTGFGLLPLAPVFSFIAALISRRRLVLAMRERGVPRYQRSLWPGVAIALVLLVGVQLPTTLTQYGIELAASSDVVRQARGIHLLRRWGDERALLRACYRNTGRVPDMISFILSIGSERVRPESVQTIYYRVTGKPFNTVPRPQNRRIALWLPEDDFVFDRDLGGDRVAGRVKGLSLSGSTLDGSVDADAGVGYLEWTLVVKNTGPIAAEARLQLGLPPGSVVSRATLWVNGEPREAAFAGRGKARQAYESVVRQARDPLLVSMTAPDAVLVQMFPVPANGRMKVRVGVTVPLVITDSATAILPLPFIRERNFNFGPDVSHAVWVESRQQIHVGKTMGVAQRKGGVYTMRATIPDSVLGTPAAKIRFVRQVQIRSAFARDPQSGSTIHQRLEFARHAFRDNVIVIDGSSTMAAYRDALAEVIAALPAENRLSIVLAGDRPVSLSTSLNHRQLAARIRDYAFAGGTDNLAALNLAWELASQREDSAIVWIHGPQPVLLSSADTLHNHWQRRPERPQLFDVSLDRGVNHIVEALVDIPAIHSVPRLADLRQDLARLFEKLDGRRPWVRYERSRGAAARSGKQSSAHLVRLWARDRVSHLIASGKPVFREQAIKLARRYHIVTPVSSAVVLASKAQYRRAGLSPVSAANVPTVPEPEEWALMIITLLILVGLHLRSRHQRYLAG